MNSITQKITNYTLLKKDEQKVMYQFKLIFEKIIKFFNDQIILTANCQDEKKLDNLFDDAILVEKSIIISIKDITEECIWLIQKHEPRASHLRFLIAIINSLNDLKRISNYVVSYSRFFAKYHQKISITMKEIITKICRLCLNKATLFLELINNEEIFSNSSNQIFDDFLTEYKKLYLNFINQCTIENNDSNLTANSIIIVKNIDRTIDHCVNIIENFANIN